MFLAIIMPVIMGGCFILSDIYIYITGRRIAEKSVEISAYALLGKYSGYLKDNYDIYSFCMDENIAEMIVKESLAANLKGSRFYDFRIDEIEIVPEKPLTEDGVLASRLRNIAPDDVYKTLAMEFMERISSMQEIPVAAEIISLKMQLDSAVKNIKEKYTLLDYIINKGNGESIQTNLLGDDGELVKFLDYCKEIKEIEKQLSVIEEEIKKSTDEKVGVLILLREKTGNIREKAAFLYSEKIEKILSKAKESNAEAISCIEEIFMENVNINYISEKLKDNTDNIDNWPEYIKEILKACIDLIKDIENAFVEQVFEEMLEKLNKNIIFLGHVAKLFENAIESGAEIEPISIEELLKEYKYDMEFTYHEAKQPGKGNDVRKFFERLGKKILEKKMGKDVSIDENRALPSKGQVKGQSPEFKVSTTGENTDSVENEIDGFSHSIKQFGMVAIQNLMLNEYILQHCTHGTKKNEKEEITHFFANEVEYILWSADNQNTNVFFTKTALMTTRFALNALHVYSDSEKRLKADTIAVATAGWWTFGVGVPVMSNLILCSWAIAEAGIDTGKLCAGQSLPVIKRKGDWITDIGINSIAAKTPEALCIDYEDYLRMFLTAVPETKKLMRFLDIVSLNAPGNFNIFECYTAVIVNVKISYKSIMGDRHETKISISQSY